MAFLICSFHAVLDFMGLPFLNAYGFVFYYDFKDILKF